MVNSRRPFEILLAEDNAADAELVREALKEYHLNCSLRVISDGAQAIEFIDRMDKDPNAPPLDLLLLDIHLPKCEGGEVLKRLRSTERYSGTPAIIITGLSSRCVQEAAMRDNVIMCFEKPSTLEEFMQLGSIVRQVLERTAQTSPDQTNASSAAHWGDVR